MKLINKAFKSNAIVYSLLVLAVQIWQIFGIGKVNLRLSRGVDQQIMQLTSAKMHYFDYSSYEAAWNHHSPFLFYLTKFSYLFSDFYQSTFGFYAVYTIYLSLISLITFYYLQIP